MKLSVHFDKLYKSQLAKQKKNKKPKPKKNNTAVSLWSTHKTAMAHTTKLATITIISSFFSLDSMDSISPFFHSTCRKSLSMRLGQYPHHLHTRYTLPHKTRFQKRHLQWTKQGDEQHGDYTQKKHTVSIAPPHTIVTWLSSFSVLVKWSLIFMANSVQVLGRMDHRGERSQLGTWWLLSHRTGHS